MNFQKLREYSPAILRIGMALVFLWFGTNQLMDPKLWTGYLPGFVGGLGIPLTTFVLMNGIFEIAMGLLLISGFLVRLSSLLLGLHLLAIAISVGYNPVGIRDVGLSLATLAVFLHGPDRLCLGKRK